MTPPPSPQECIEAIIAAQGNAKLAAARISKERYNDTTTITEARLLAIVTQDPNSLNTLTTQIRLLTVMQAADAFRLTHAAFLASLSELSAPATARTYLSLLNTMTTLSNLSTPPSDPYEAIMRSLPADVTTALNNLLAPTTPQNTPNNDIALPTIITNPPAPPDQPRVIHNADQKDGPEWMRPSPYARDDNTS